ncbi:MAG: two-component system, NarL family, sensor histidine kinase DegS [Clostridiales bacterium]|nr:two-component system, NarL family, sensor histidine kinase DegS [Clostridiales bacterium]
MKKECNYLLSSLRAMEMQELDRKRISMEIHDTTVQNLTTLVHKVEYATKLLDIDPMRTRLELNTMTEILRDSIEELREIIFDLRPMCLDDLGLVAAIERYIDQIQLESDAIKYSLHVSAPENENVLPIVNLMIFRVVQEALVNIRKHAKAKNAEINIVNEKCFIMIEVKDNGVGFTISQIDDKRKNFGISIMKERIKLLSGEIDINSIIGKGTVIKIKVPVVEEEKYDAD